MSVPRRIIPGTTYLLGRRCFGRQFLLRPNEKINQIFKFCLAVAAERTGVLVHNYCVLSNHYHVVATDVHGKLPDFMHWLNEYVAKCVNAELGRWESFWAPGSYSSVRLVEHDDVIRKLAYVSTNPVDARLVRTHTDWPGAMSLPSQMDGDPVVVHRPEGFFREKGPVPETATLRVVSPPSFAEARSESLVALALEISSREQNAHERARAEDWRFLGVRRVLAQSPLGRPDSYEPRLGLNPRVASQDKWKRIEALERLQEFLGNYRDALKRFISGQREVVFPYGTYGMRVRFAVNCAGP